jgi:hypothetical protein
LERRLNVLDVDLQQRRREGPARLAFSEHDGGIADLQLGVQQQPVVIHGACVGAVDSAEHVGEEAHQPVGVAGDEKGVDGGVPGGNVQLSHGGSPLRHHPFHADLSRRA